jgi:hypothetical protein
MATDEQSRKNRERGGDLGRFAGRLVKNAGPNTKRFIDENRPKVEKALQDTRPKVEKAIQDARPHVEKAVEVYRPRVEQAGRDAVRYVQDHPEQVQAMAMKGVRMRLGPLGMAMDALGLNVQQPPSPPPPSVRICPGCGTRNAPRARFCSECGRRLEPPPPPPTS